MAIIGIDLGTTNSLAAVFRNGKAELIPNAFQEFLTPSVVSKNEDGEIFVGKIAKERLITHPDKTAASFKRFMGSGQKVRFGAEDVLPEALSSFVLRRLKADAEAYLHEPVTEAVVSVPAYFNDRGRNAVKRAGALAGLHVERIINEPSAAALAYKLKNEENSTYLVFDFGGGTLDVSIVDAFENMIEILAVSGDNRLGGDDFNTVIAEWFCRSNQLDFHALSDKLQAILRKQAENAKIALTTAEIASIILHIEGKTYSATLTNRQLLDIAADLFVRMELPIRTALRDARLTRSDIDAVVLVGGSSKMPVVKMFLAHLFDTELLSGFAPDEIVALGAATVAGIKARQEEIKDVILTDICPFTLGVGILNHADSKRDLLSPIIERNTTLPASRVENYCTTQDGQTELRLDIYQGEKYYAEDNLKLDTLRVPVPAGPAGRENADVRFTYDLNGIILVDVQVKSTGLTKQAIIDDPQNQHSQAELQAILESLEAQKLKSAENAENDLLLERAQRVYEESLAETRELLHNAISYFETEAVHAKGPALRNARARLSHLLDQIEGFYDTDLFFETENDEEDFENE